MDLFNYYYSRHESSTNDSQREKLESDLKKEIKKLQKFRDQIKTWQGNDSLEATIASLKLQEHRRLVEEAMECYKEVEKNSKMKSFSNQSIMLASLENGEHSLPPEVEDAYEYLAGVTDELLEQNEQLEKEYEKISQKKVRKNNLLAIEERKQELENYRLRNEFHIAKIESTMSYLKANKVSVQLVWDIQEDLNFYVESNQEPDFVDDETLYDDLIREARENHENNTVVMNEANGVAQVRTHGAEVLAEENMALDNSPELVNKTIPPKAKSASGTPASRTSPSPDAPEIPSKPTLTPKGKLTTKSLILESSSPAFVTTLKPASAPSKPVAGLKWSIAAAGNSQSGSSPPPSPSLSQGRSISTKNSDETKIPTKASDSTSDSSLFQTDYITDQNDVDASSELLSLLTKNEEYSPYLEVLKNTKLLPAEFEVFKDMELLRSPSGIQSYATSFTAANKLNELGTFLRKTPRFDPFSCTLMKPYLPQQGSRTGSNYLRPPLFSSKLQTYWNRVRSSNQFTRFCEELQSLEEQSSTESMAMAKELVMVLFYGYYYGFLPLENIIAESLLHKLGWKPYDIGAEPTEGFLESQHTLWIKKIPRASLLTEAETDLDCCDFKFFDVNSWEISVKYGFKFDPRMSRSIPASSLA